MSWFGLFLAADGEWDWDNYEMVALSQKKNIPVTAMAAVKYSVWCAIGNTVHVLHTHHLKCEVCVCVCVYVYIVYLSLLGVMHTNVIVYVFWTHFWAFVLEACSLLPVDHDPESFVQPRVQIDNDRMC